VERTAALLHEHGLARRRRAVEWAVSGLKKNHACSSAAAAAKACFHKGSPVHHQNFRISADEDAAAAAAQGRAVDVVLPTVGKALAVFPPDAEVDQTILFFELPTCNAREPNERWLREQHVSRVAQLLETLRERKQEGELVRLPRNDRCCWPGGSSVTSKAPRQTLQEEKGREGNILDLGGNNNDDDDSPNDNSEHQEVTAEAVRRPSVRKTVKVNTALLAQSLRDLSEAREAAEREEDALHDYHERCGFCSLFTCSGVCSPRAAVDAEPDEVEQEASAESIQNEAASPSVPGRGGSLQIGWVVMPLSLETSPKVYLLLIRLGDVRSRARLE
jgi:hypothetical protein